MFDLANHNLDVLTAEVEYRHHVEPVAAATTGRRRHRWLRRRSVPSPKTR
jgi:hypothetical protein